jgi:exopolysaccharide biosynthesis polyprenyl glycosylphosphotransferase
MKYRALRKIILVLGDIFLLFFALFISLSIRKGFPPSFEEFYNFAKSFIWLFLFWIFLLFIFDFYSLKLKVGTIRFFRYFFIFIFLSIFSGILYFYFQPSLAISPKTILLLQIVIFCVLFLIWRFFFNFLFKRGAKQERILFLGSSPELEELLHYLKNFSSRYEVIGVYKIEKNLEEIKEIINRKKVRRVVISSANDENIKEIFSSFPELKIESFYNFYEINTQRMPLSSLRDPSFLEEFYKEKNKSYITLKRIFDIIFSLIGVLILAILYPFIAIAIKVDSSGPVFFIQERIGKGRKFSRSYKFRSMISSPQKERNELWREKRKGEITKVGKFLRFTHLDELPQFLNILRGDISFIGPRPEWKKIGENFEKEISFYFLRYRVKPGLTGWAQINLPPSRSVGEAKEKFQYDLYYIKHRSFLFDIIIFLKSLRKIFG